MQPGSATRARPDPLAHLFPAAPLPGLPQRPLSRLRLPDALAGLPQSLPQQPLLAPPPPPHASSPRPAPPALACAAVSPPPRLDTQGDRGSASTPDLLGPPSSTRYRHRWWLKNKVGFVLDQAGVRCAINACGHGGRELATTFTRQGVPDVGGNSRILVGGVLWCGSARCPRCAPLVAGKVSERIGKLLTAVREKEAAAAFMTLTAAHDPWTRLADMRRALGDAFKALQHGRPWGRLKDGGLLGLVRVWEVTGGLGGWHLHAHVLVVHRDGLEAALAAGRELTKTWIGLVGTRGFRAVAEAQDVRPVSDGTPIGDYGAKALRSWGAASELASGWLKAGRRPDRLSLPQIAGLAAHGDPWARLAYVEAVVALKGQRVLVVGPSIKKALGVDFADVVDEEAVDLVEEPGELLGEMAAATWTQACRLCLSAWCLDEIDRLAVREARPWPEVLDHLRRRIWRGADPDG